jgi:hypothetical protein
MEKIIEHKNNYDNKGTILVNTSDVVHPLSEDDINQLNLFCEKVDKEYISIGDAGESNNLLVGRFMTDIEKPLVVENPYSEKVIKILSQEKVIKFIKKILNIDEEVFLRRVQFNQIDKDCFVGYHLDTDSNPDYLAAGVIQLGKNYKGGLYRVYQKNNSYFDYKSTFGDLIISNCNYPHEVTKVLDGERKSLVFFISNNSGKNNRKKK